MDNEKFIYIRRDVETLQKLVKQLKTQKEDLREDLRIIGEISNDAAIKFIVTTILKFKK